MGAGRGTGKMMFLQRRNGKSKSVEVGKRRPNSGNAISLTELHLKAPHMKGGRAGWNGDCGQMVEFRGPGQGVWAFFFCGLTDSG